MLIICMLDFQAKELQKLKCFQIDLTFKRVYGDINEFEVNAYNDTHNLSKYILILNVILLFFYEKLTFY